MERKTYAKILAGILPAYVRHHVFRRLLERNRRLFRLRFPRSNVAAP